VCVCVCVINLVSVSRVISDTGEVSNHSHHGPVIYSIPDEHLRPNWYTARGIFTKSTEFFNPDVIRGFILHGLLSKCLYQQLCVTRRFRLEDKRGATWVSVLRDGVGQLVEALRCKPEGHGFYSRWGYWDFSLN